MLDQNVLRHYEAAGEKVKEIKAAQAALADIEGANRITVRVDVGGNAGSVIEAKVGTPFFEEAKKQAARLARKRVALLEEELAKSAPQGQNVQAARVDVEVNERLDPSTTLSHLTVAIRRAVAANPDLRVTLEGKTRVPMPRL